MKRLHIALIMLIGLIGALCFKPVDAAAQSARYALETQSIRGDESNTMVTLHDRKLKRVLWKRQMDNPGVTWSKDKRAVVLDNLGHFWVWREGYPLRHFAVPAGFDYTMGYAWSPDNRRLLIRLGLSGMSDVDAGRLFCLRLGRGNTYKYSHVAGGVREMKWRNSKTVFYRLLDYATGKVSRPYRWRIR